MSADLKDDLLKQSKRLIDEEKVFLIMDIFNEMDNELKRAFISMLHKWIEKTNFKL